MKREDREADFSEPALFDEERREGKTTIWTRDPKIPLPLPAAAVARVSDLFSRTTRLNASILSNKPIEALLDEMVAVALEFTRADRVLIFCREDGAMSLMAARGEGGGSGDEPLYSSTMVAEASERGRVILTHDAVEDERFNEAKSVIALRLRSVLVLPMNDGEAVVGCLYLDNLRHRRMFGSSDIYLAEALASQAAVALRTARLVKDNRALLARMSRQVTEQRREMQQLQRHPSPVEDDPQPQHDYPHIVGRSLPLRRLLSLVDRAIESPVPVMILGESGTGKELVAQAIHEKGPRSSMPLISVNCCAISPGLFESEFFGHVRGSFTGSVRDRKGHFQAADKGTLFLDEVTEISHDQQAKLLRAIQDGEIMPVGSSKGTKVDVRIISASNRDVDQLVRDKKLRDDLYYRLGVFILHVPPLRDRLEDIPLLARHFLDRLGERRGQSLSLSRKVVHALLLHDWPGNVRELENVVGYLSLFADESGVIDRADGLPLASGEEGAAEPLLIPFGTPLAEVERLMVVRTLAQTGWNRTRASHLLGIDRSTLYRRLKALQIPLPQDAED